MEVDMKLPCFQLESSRDMSGVVYYLECIAIQIRAS